MNPPPDPRTINLGTITVGEASELLESLPLGHTASDAAKNLYRRVHAQLHSPLQGEPMPQQTGFDEDDVLRAPPALVRDAPSRLPRCAQIVRKVDVTGISGLGVIGELCEFSDGFTVIRWLGGPPQNQPKIEVYDNRGTAPFEQISGHGGNTVVAWLGEDDSEEVPLGQ